MVVILLGPPGAGKGTQCKRIAEKFNLSHLSSGDILRSERAAGSELGRQAAGYMDSGRLVPDELIIKMMAGAINKSGGNCVLDGFPRTTVQAAELEKAMAKDGRKINAVVNLIVDDSVLEGRITGRRSCPACGAVYHIETLRPKKEGFCDKCKGQKLVQRPDDSPAVIQQRLKTYHRQTAEVVDYYSGGYEILNIDAARPIDVITADIIDGISSAAVG